MKTIIEMEKNKNQNSTLLFKSYNKVGMPIGKGMYGTVYIISCLNGQIYALKEYNKKDFHKQPHMKKLLKDELRIMKKLNHSRILKCHHVHNSDDNKKICIIMDYCDGGDLASFQSNNYLQGLPEALALKFLYQIVQGYHVLYFNKILHRDIKLNNILIKDGQLVIGDFGFAKINASKSREKLGTLNYMAPEILNKKKKYYDSRADMWSIGICLYKLLFGVFPFEGYNNDQIYLNQQKYSGLNLRIRGKQPSLLVECLLKQMLQFDCKERIKFDELFCHPLINIEKRDLYQNQESNQTQILNKIFQLRNRQSLGYNILQNSSSFSSCIDTEKNLQTYKNGEKATYFLYLQNIIIYIVDSLKSIQKTLIDIEQPLLKYWLSIIQLIVSKKLINYNNILQKNIVQEELLDEKKKFFVNSLKEYSQDLYLQSQKLDDEMNARYDFDQKLVNDYDNNTINQILREVVGKAFYTYLNLKNGFKIHIQKQIALAIATSIWCIECQRSFPLQQFKTTEDWKSFFYILENQDLCSLENILFKNFQFQFKLYNKNEQHQIRERGSQKKVRSFTKE